MDSKAHMKSKLAEAEQHHFVRAVQAASRSRQPERQRLPKIAVLRRLVISLGYSAP
jgi:hypothetical protein